jgi:hypothetical protein
VNLVVYPKLSESRRASEISTEAIVRMSLRLFFGSSNLGCHPKTCQSEMPALNVRDKTGNLSAFMRSRKLECTTKELQTLTLASEFQSTRKPSRLPSSPLSWRSTTPCLWSATLAISQLPRVFYTYGLRRSRMMSLESSQMLDFCSIGLTSGACGTWPSS